MIHDGRSERWCRKHLTRLSAKKVDLSNERAQTRETAGVKGLGKATRWEVGRRVRRVKFVRSSTLDGWIDGWDLEAVEGSELRSMSDSLAFSIDSCEAAMVEGV